MFADNYSEEQYSKGVNEISFNDKKYKALLEIISNQEDNKIIVFAFFRKTLLYLKNRLQNDGFKAGLIFGGIDMTERNKIIDSFFFAILICLLLAGNIIIIIICIITESFYGVWSYIGTYCIHI